MDEFPSDLDEWNIHMLPYITPHPPQCGMCIIFNTCNTIMGREFVNRIL